VYITYVCVCIMYIRTLGRMCPGGTALSISLDDDAETCVDGDVSKTENSMCRRCRWPRFFVPKNLAVGPKRIEQGCYYHHNIYIYKYYKYTYTIKYTGRPTVVVYFSKIWSIKLWTLVHNICKLSCLIINSISAPVTNNAQKDKMIG